MGTLGFFSESQDMTLNVKKREQTGIVFFIYMYQPVLTIPQNSWKQSDECAIWI